MEDLTNKTGIRQLSYLLCHFERLAQEVQGWNDEYEDCHDITVCFTFYDFNAAREIINSISKFIMGSHDIAIRHDSYMTEIIIHFSNETLVLNPSLKYWAGYVDEEI